MTPELTVIGVVPLGQRVVVRLHKRNARTASGLYIPETAGANTAVQTIGTVVKTAEPLDDDNLNDLLIIIRTGDVVVFGKFNGTEIKVGDDDLVVVPVSEIVCKLLVQEAAPAAQS